MSMGDSIDQQKQRTPGQKRRPLLAYFLIAITVIMSAPFEKATADEAGGDTGGWVEHQARRARSKHSYGGFYCPAKTPRKKVVDLANQTLGADSGCWMKLFDKETGGQPTCRQSAAVKGNDSVGYGLCTLNKDRRKRTSYGGPCASNANINGGTDTGIVNQMLCCQHIMKHLPKYFGGASRRAYNKCMTGKE